MADLAGFSRAASGHLALAALALCGALGGCGGGDDGGGDAPGADGGGPPGVELAADEGAIRLPVGGSAVVAVTAERTGGFEGDLVLEVSGLPGGVTAEPVSLPAGASEASLTLEATDAAEQGGPLALSIQVRSPEDDSVAAELERALYVAGPPGSLDASFGEGGIASLPLVDGQVLVRGIALDREGRLLVAGTLSTPAGLEIALVRLTAGGQPDAELAAGGAIRTSLGGEEPRAMGVVATADGILLSALLTSGDDDIHVVRRYTAAGLVDSSFGASGDVRLPGPVSLAPHMAVRGDQLLIAQEELVLALDAEGDIDTSLQATSPLGGAAGAIAVDPAGAILLGTAELGPQALARLRPGGAPDGGFGAGGVLALPLAAEYGGQKVASIAAGADGGGLAIANAKHTSESLYRAHLVAFSPAGALDPSFGEGGVLELGDATTSGVGVDLAIDAKGRAIVLGALGTEAFLWRFTRDGALDGELGDGGVVSLGSNAGVVGRRMIHDPVAGRVALCAGSTAGALTCSRRWL